ncbi:MAG: helix-turn-helix transcriptional regulator [Phycisphaerae bacterium]|nr:helix-turn-helix transcriptional regulator [Phycisphaerae bacterium]
MDLFEHISMRIRDLRTGYGGEGVSQEALANALETTANTISRWETGTYKPSIQDLDRLSRFFGVSILTFFPGDEERGANDQVAALLRAAKQLKPADVEELRRYAEFRKARSLYGAGQRPRRGRKREKFT